MAVSRALGLLLASIQAIYYSLQQGSTFSRRKIKKGNRISRSVLRRHLQSLGFRW